MAFQLQHLHSGWEVDQAIVREEERIVGSYLCFLTRVPRCAVAMMLLGFGPQFVFPDLSLITTLVLRPRSLLSLPRAQPGSSSHSALQSFASGTIGMQTACAWTYVQSPLYHYLLRLFRSIQNCLAAVAPKCVNFAAFYVVDISEVPDFNKMYELYDPVTVMFFYRNKHIMIDLGTGNNNKSTFHRSRLAPPFTTAQLTGLWTTSRT